MPTLKKNESKTQLKFSCSTLLRIIDENLAAHKFLELFSTQQIWWQHCWAGITAVSGVLRLPTNPSRLSFIDKF